MLLASFVDATSVFSKPAGTTQIFTLGFAVCCLVKFLSEMSRGYWSYLEPGRYVRFSLDQAACHPFLYFSRTYKTANLLHLSAVVGLLAGAPTAPCLAVMTQFFYYQTTVLFRYHTCYYCLMALALFAGTVSGTAWLAPALVSTLTTALYVFSAYRKLREREFTSGFSLGITMRHLGREGRKRVYNFDNVLGALKITRPSHLWTRWASRSVIAAEFLLPVLLFIPALKLLGMAIGILMHFGFTLMQPRTLFHFGLLTTLSYMMY